MAAKIKEGMTGGQVADIIEQNFENLEDKFQQLSDQFDHIKEDINRTLDEYQSQVDDAYGSIATQVDEEDTTTDKGKIKLKDRAYEPDKFSGKGYKILRKNIVCNIETGESKNILTQDMINEPNTVYEIRYDFDLNGETINIPNGCTLQFSGGKISNGLLISNNTRVINIYEDLYIIGKIFNGDNREITYKGDIINRNTRLLFPFLPETYNNDEYRVNIRVKNARLLGITDCIGILHLGLDDDYNVYINEQNYINADNYINRIKSNGMFNSLYALKFHTEGGFDDTVDPSLWGNNWVNLIYNTVSELVNKGLNFECVYIINEQETWLSDTKYEPYVSLLINKIQQLGKKVGVAHNSTTTIMYNILNSDAIVHDRNYYPRISLADDKTVVDSDLINTIVSREHFPSKIFGVIDYRNVGVTETGVCGRLRSLRSPYSFGENLGEYNEHIYYIYFNALAEINKQMNFKRICLWFIENYDKHTNMNNLYNIFNTKF